MASEQVLEVLVRRHIIECGRSFMSFLNGIFDGISQPDFESLLGRLAASTSYEEFSSGCRKEALGSRTTRLRAR